MKPTGVHQLSERFTDVSDRFRSLWTFYQFLGGVYRHLGQGEVPYSYDFQALYRRLQEMVPRVGMGDLGSTDIEFEQVERELGRIHGELEKIEASLPPSLLRRFFDHLKRQDEKILFALIKFYLRSPELSPDTLDKLDLLLTRIAENPTQEGRVSVRSTTELKSNFERLATFGSIPGLRVSEAAPLAEALRDFRTELRGFSSFDQLVDSGVYDRYRKLKQRLGRNFLHPPLLLEVVATNIEAKNQFQRLYRDEELKIIEETTKVFEIERFLERNPAVGHDELKQRLEAFREWWSRFDAGRRDDNLKREAIVELRRSMHAVIREFEPLRRMTELAKRQVEVDASVRATPFSPDVPTDVIEGEPFPEPTDAVAQTQLETRATGGTLTEVLSPDPLLNEVFHRIMFALEMVVWDRSPEQAVHAPELVELHLEPWEIAAYRSLVDERVGVGTTEWELEAFFLRSAALRIKMDGERSRVRNLAPTESADRVFEILERSGQSLERAREMDHRFQWFIDDLLYSGDTTRLEQLYRSRFRFLHAYSGLWLEHQARGGLTPL
ncbi:MAG: hypothetical protein C3F15_08435 [Holophagae bacterium]|nr:MAG: hypothetical protein C3F15_08435 [Holophagae bacterium]